MDAPPISKPLLGFFRRIVRRYFSRSFHAVRISNRAHFESASTGPLIVYANHSSWWDPMIAFLLAAESMPQRNHYAPMDAMALRRYRILSRLGVFGVDRTSARGAVQFFRTGLHILKRHGVLWITPQGRFADLREEPMTFEPGLATLACRVEGGCTVLPLAIEYVFWDERLPEALLHFGKPIWIEGESVAEAEGMLQTALQLTMQQLAVKAIARKAGNFEVLHAGRAGTGGFYEAGQRILARLRGRRYRPEHSPSPAGEKYE